MWSNVAQLRGAMYADDFRDCMLSFLFPRLLSDNYEQAERKELGADCLTSDLVDATRKDPGDRSQRDG
ncbi:MAG TPA: type I restriction-modification system subunit M N-terminal domain-containing protein [Dokdonella sp.]|uniref:type I restriction-modification system subunit M N-terminal domain-containing protein n=1 Tax=Dokdonella sp. TaxID=2291710 RepID=UPI0025BBF132|nr:type I restriction-modification system subunit M N-terminal domain-containing protein [Dokdonella sp.]HNV08380.1 type I restriction-modification system subunit M N-terminal domain-containing protein [Dokdonella sp.]HPW03844.1 type I restriction-modification system subunit M N-terminal domain-containing protein [Dokdonella sp.]HQV49881.1 type I restriction-modification system subunit M N-terminal domain-containing protein [Dokdonella sp.]HQX34145.1 type I restriction-modification system subun